MVIVLRFENVTFPDYIRFKCKNCGRCCREQPADVTADEQKRIETMGFNDFLDEQDSSEPRLIKSKKGGGCWFLTETNGCAIHEVKPAICQLVPFVVVDWDYEKNLIEVDLPADCDCPGITAGSSQLPVETLGKAAQNFVHDQLMATAKEQCLPASDTRVLSKTRLRILKMAIDEEMFVRR
jgi:Fe-S-cluster containining protein